MKVLPTDGFPQSHESAALSKHLPHLHIRTLAKGAAQIDSPNETVDVTFETLDDFANGTAQVNTTNAIGILCKSAPRARGPNLS